MDFYHISTWTIEFLIVIGVWFEVWLFWKFQSIKNQASIKRTVRKFLKSLVGITK